MSQYCKKLVGYDFQPDFDDPGFDLDRDLDLARYCAGLKNR